MRTGSANSLGDHVAGDFDLRAAPSIPPRKEMSGGRGPLFSMNKKCSLCGEPAINDGLCRGHLQARRMEAATADLLKRAEAERECSNCDGAPDGGHTRTGDCAWNPKRLWP